jgi:large subunit ribosomal protein L19
VQNHLMELVEQSSMKKEVPSFEIGDTVDVHVRILEGEKERIQVFNGVVIARSGHNTREMFTVRRIVAGEGVERIFPLHSPRISDIVVKRSGHVRRAKLYYLRERTGKAVRLRERYTGLRGEAAQAAKVERKAARKASKAAAAEARLAAAEAAKAAAANPPAETAPEAPASES